MSSGGEEKWKFPEERLARYQLLETMQDGVMAATYNLVEEPLAC